MHSSSERCCPANVSKLYPNTFYLSTTIMVEKHRTVFTSECCKIELKNVIKDFTIFLIEN